MEIQAERVLRIICQQCSKHLDVAHLAPFSGITCPECDFEQKVPAKFGNFLLLHELGKGGMGAAYYALDQTLGRYVAVKVMQKSTGDAKGHVDQFLREAKATAALNHRNVVAIYSCGQEKEQPYIVMELVPNGSWEELMKAQQPASEVRSLEVAIDVAQGLEAANEVGLIHGDIKPGNVLFDKNNIGKVVDFGLAHFARQTSGGEVWGTPYYIAPEQARGKPTDHRGDIYSLGGTLFHVLAGRPPFEGKTATDVVVARFKQPAPDLAELRPDLQPETCRVVARMLEQKPGRRYPTYDSLLGDLKEALRRAQGEGLGSSAGSESAVPKILAGLAVIGVLIGGAFLLRKKAPEPVTRTPSSVSGPRVVKKLVRGKMVDVIVTNPVVSGTATTEAVEVGPDVNDRVFDEMGRKAIDESAKLLADNDPAEALFLLQKEIKRTGENTLSGKWFALLQGLISVGSADDTGAKSYLQSLQVVRFPKEEGVHPEQEVMLQSLSGYLLGSFDSDLLKSAAGAERPAWFADLCELAQGIMGVKEKEYEAAEKRFATYASVEEPKTAWPYAYQKTAKQWAKQTKDWRTLIEEIPKIIEEKNPTEARERLEKFSVKSRPLFTKLIKKEITKVKRKETKYLRTVKKEKLVSADEVQADLDVLDAYTSSALALVAKRDFSGAYRAIRKAPPPLKSSEGKQALKNAEALCKSLKDFRQFLEDQLSQHTYNGVALRSLGGRPVGVTKTGVRVRISAHGEAVKPWSALSNADLLQLADYYLKLAELDKKERAPHAVALATYCYIAGGFKKAEEYAQLAVELDEGQASDIHRFMPGLL